MALNLISNFPANVALRNLGKTDAAVSSSLAKLSSGTRVLSASDDAASLAIGSRLRAEVAAMRQASVNAGQASSMLQIADGAFSTSADILVRMKSLAVQSSSGQLSSVERGSLQLEFAALRNELTRIGNDTEFNGTFLVNGSQTASAASYTGANGVDAVRAANLDTTATYAIVFTAATDTFTVTQTGGVEFGGDTYTAVAPANQVTGETFNNPVSLTLTSSNANNNGSITLDLSTAFDLGTNVVSEALTVAGSNTLSVSFKVGTGVQSFDNVAFTIESLVSISASISFDIDTASNADQASLQVSTAIDTLNSARSTVGAGQNRLSFASANVATAIENAEAARSELLDLDVASEMTMFTSKQILLQAGVSMLAQAQQLPQNLLRLFQ